MEQVATQVTDARQKKMLNGHAFRRHDYLRIMPVLLFLLVVFVFPLGSLCRRSLFDPSFTLAHYERLISEPVYVNVLWVTFRIAVIVTLLTVLLGYPLAYAAFRARPGWRKWTILSFVLLPFWTSLLVRTFSFMMLLQRKGLINDILLRLHLVDEPIPMVYNLTGVLVGMTYMLLPYMVLPLYSVLDRVDPMLERSALGLGASRTRAFFSTTLPLSTPGVAAGASLVFLLSLGFFVTPALLGGRKEQMLSMVIESQVNEVLNWGFASALCVMLLVATLLFGAILLLIGRAVSKRTSVIEELT